MMSIAYPNIKCVSVIYLRKYNLKIKIRKLSPKHNPNFGISLIPTIII